MQAIYYCSVITIAVVSIFNPAFTCEATPQNCLPRFFILMVNKNLTFYLSLINFAAIRRYG
jgi:hypothetical protein